MGPFQELGRSVDLFVNQVVKTVEPIAQGLLHLKDNPTELIAPVIFVAASALLIDVLHDPPLLFVTADKLSQRIRPRTKPQIKK